MPKFAPDGTTYIPWTIDADQVGGVDVDPSPNNTTTYLRADGTWATPPGSGGTVTSVSGSAPITSTGGTTPVISISAASGIAAGSMSSADFTKLAGIGAGANVVAVGVTAPATLGGTAQNPTIGVQTFGAAQAGAVPLSGGGTSNFLRADGTWAVPAGTGVTSVGATAPITSSGGTTPTIAITAATTLAAGSMSAADKTKLDGLPTSAVPTSRTIGTTAPLTGGGDLSADRTLAISQFAGSSPGAVPTSLGGTANYLRADGSWATPAGTGVTSVSGTAPISSSGGLTPAISLDANGVTDAKFRQSGALAVVGRSANSTGNVADIQATAASGAVLRESGSTIGFGTIATAGIANNAVTLAKLATQADQTFLGNISGGAAVPSALTVAQTDGALIKSTTVDPTVSDNNAAGYYAGKRWINTTGLRTWECRGDGDWARTGGGPQTFQADAGTVALYRFDNNVNDSSGNALNLTASGTVYYPGALGNRRASLWTVSATSASLATNSLNLSSDMCVTMLAYVRPSATAQTILQYGANGNSRVYYVDTQAVNSRLQINWGYGTGAASVGTTTQVLPDQWVVLHLVRTISGGATTLKVYANGFLTETLTTAASVPTSANNTVYVSRNATGATTQCMNNGMLGGIRIGTTIPSDAQIKYEAQLYHPYPQICI